MSNVEFEDAYKPAPRFNPQGGVPNFPGMPGSARGMAGWLMQKGIIKNEDQAKGVLLAVVVFNFILMGIVFYFFVL